MSEPFLGEIKMFACNFAPKGWALCNGQFLPINQNQALFALLGTMYGGNGQTTFALPNLRGRVPIHVANGYTQGQASGQTSHTITISELPAHLHDLGATTQQTTVKSPDGAIWAAPAVSAYHDGGANTVMYTANQYVTNTGGSQAHNNMQPYLVLNFCIALQGIFPSQN
ncbi:microcystin-dependent protein [Paenibacillus phyllosphaerae]|uniref:Microcystin-dependent protein n=1 Tax=Paenibacillus phyllosphaerae TaxID=274593 RepID=A0A7W5B050_9BACL|nr:tail fiber protein [Paenibacillus phyllosphaerae]MBB3112005.1 microcystin-dependent protein [Paenibacillus phyllosphaerae]